MTIDSESGDLICPPSVNSIGLLDSADNKDAIHGAIAEKCESLLSQAGRREGSIEAFTEKRAFREHLKTFISSKCGRKPMILCNISRIDTDYYDRYYGDT